MVRLHALFLRFLPLLLSLPSSRPTSTNALHFAQLSSRPVSSRLSRSAGTSSSQRIAFRSSTSSLLSSNPADSLLFPLPLFLTARSPLAVRRRPFFSSSTQTDLLLPRRSTTKLLCFDTHTLPHRFQALCALSHLCIWQVDNLLPLLIVIFVLSFPFRLADSVRASSDVALVVDCARAAGDRATTDGGRDRRLPCFSRGGWGGVSVVAGKDEGEAKKARRDWKVIRGEQG